MITNLHEFLNSHRAVGDDWNITGMSNDDKGKYKISDAEYDTFLNHVHTHINVPPYRASSLLERHPDVGGPPLVDLDFHYDSGGPLLRRFSERNIQSFIAEYVGAMIYFSKVEDLPNDLYFYSLIKPAAETDKSGQKDGIHIQCPTITTDPKYQFCIRGYLLGRNVISKIFGELSNTVEDCYDVSVIHRNNWFLYGACKQDKAQYRIETVWKIAIQDVIEALDGGDPTDPDEIVEIVQDLMTTAEVPPITVETMKLLSIRCRHDTLTPLDIRSDRSVEWEELASQWGGGKKKPERKTTIQKKEGTPSNEIIVTKPREDDDVMSIADTTPEEDIALAYKIMKECLDPEKRAGDYYDWVKLAICLKNIANTEASFESWVELTRRVDPSHTKASRSDAELRSKWNVIRIGGDAPKLTIASLISWAKEDNLKKLEAIQDIAHATWIINFAKDTHVNVAKFVKRCYRHDYRCSVGAKRNNYEWYHYPKGSHSWKHLKTSTMIRQKLSEEVKNHYVNAQMELGRRHNMPENLTNSAEKERIDDKRKKLMGIESKLENTSFKDSVMKECQETFYDEEFVSRLNINPFLVGVANGVLELNYYDDTLKRERVNFRPGLPDDNISFQMGHSDDKEAISYYPYNQEEPEQIELMNFFKKIYPDEILRKYVLTLLGSCLEGQNKEQKFFINQGAGSNGKSMIQILMDNTFGDYQTSLHTAILTRKRADAGSANPDLITMKCKRYMYMNEPDNGEKLNTANMKQMSGEDKIQARGLFSDQEKFSVMGKIFMSCNDMPPVGTMDNGTWRRIRVIPHTSTFKDPGDPAIDPSKHIYEKDFHLTTKLVKWRTAFLSLLVHYYNTVYLVHGIQEPNIVKAASDKYKETNDVFMTFFTENFVSAQGEGPIHSKEVKKIFREWKRHLGRACDLKEQDVVERMAKQCGGASSDKEFWNVRVQTDDDTQNLMIVQ